MYDNEPFKNNQAAKADRRQVTKTDLGNGYSKKEVKTYSKDGDRKSSKSVIKGNGEMIKRVSKFDPETGNRTKVVTKERSKDFGSDKKVSRMSTDKNTGEGVVKTKKVTRDKDYGNSRKKYEYRI